MNLAIFFDPVSEAVISDHPLPGSWESHIRIFHNSFPSWLESDIAIIGLTEERGTTTNKGVSKAADAIRKKLYALKKGTGSYHISDLGNLRNGETLDETCLRLKEVCENLLQHNVIPVLIGGSHDLDYGQYLAYQSLEKPITLLNIDSKIDIDVPEDPSQNHINKILTSSDSYLFHYAHLAYQSFLVEKQKLDTLEKLHFELYRLGQVREFLEETEPVIRTADMITFDISAVKMSDAPGCTHAQVFGLSGEDACQICWYAGINSRMSSIGFYEYNPDLDQRDITASVLATMIWYFTEGYYHRNKELDVNDPRFTKYIVSFKEEPHHLVFYKDTLTDKWWMEVPFSEAKSRYARNALVPCSYKDYKDASNGEIPNRWIITHAKLS